MTFYVIRGDSVTAHSSAPATISDGELVVQSIGDIEASGLSKAELTAIWNALPGTTKLAKFKDRKTAAQRLGQLSPSCRLIPSRFPGRQPRGLDQSRPRSSTFSGGPKGPRSPKSSLQPGGSRTRSEALFPER